MISGSALPLTHVIGRHRPYSPNEWPYDIQSVNDVLNKGLNLGSLTILVGENGAGKSTLVEAIAMAYGLNAEGGSTHATHSTQSSESDLFKELELTRSAGANRWGFFLRAETMHGFFTYLANNPGRDPDFHKLSHGESFIEILRRRLDGPGLYVLDEPESALSFTGCLALAGLLHDLASSGTAQVLLATHSPVLAAIPGANLLEVTDNGLISAEWQDLDLVRQWQQFLSNPESFLRHISRQEHSL